MDSGEGERLVEVAEALDVGDRLAHVQADNSHLHATAYRMAVVGIEHNPIIRAHYDGMRAGWQVEDERLGHCMRKALSLVWGIQTI